MFLLSGGARACADKAVIDRWVENARARPPLHQLDSGSGPQEVQVFLMSGSEVEGLDPPVQERRLHAAHPQNQGDGFWVFMFQNRTSQWKPKPSCGGGAAGLLDGNRRDQMKLMREGVLWT